MSLKARGRSGKHCMFNLCMYPMISKEVIVSTFNSLARLNHAKFFLVFFLPLSNKQVCFSKVLLWHAYSTSSLAPLQLYIKVDITKKPHYSTTFHHRYYSLATNL